MSEFKQQASCSNSLTVKKSCHFKNIKILIKKKEKKKNLEENFI